MCLIGPEPRTAPETGRFQGFTSRTRPADSSDLEESDLTHSKGAGPSCYRKSAKTRNVNPINASNLDFKVIIIIFW